MENNIFIFSDPHFGHKNIVRSVSSWDDKSGCRDFNSIEEMNETIVKNINSTVSENDFLFCLGDWSFGGQANISKYRNMINVKEISLIPGNHDDKLVSLIRTDPLVRSAFVLCRDITIFKCHGCIFVLSHMPVRDDIVDKLLSGRNIDNTPIILINGHLHGSKYPDNGFKRYFRLDASIETNDYLPYNILDIIKLYNESEYI